MGENGLLGNVELGILEKRPRTRRRLTVKETILLTRCLEATYS
jgi:hypothetical protein